MGVAAVAAPADTRAYLDLLYGTADHGHLSVWTPGTDDTGGASNTTWASVTDLDAVAATVAALTAAGRDAYHGVGLQAAPLGRSRRGTSEGVIALPGVWMDVDIAGPAHAQAALPPTQEDALDLIDTFPLEPSLIVHSGHGLYPWWLFPEVLYVESEAERAELASIVRRAQRTIIRGANGRGWYPEFTGDLARVLRFLGSWNLKPGLPPAPVFALYTSGRRYTRDDFEGFLPDDEAPPRPSANGRVWGEHERADLGAIVAGCGFMAHWRDDAATLPEPEWHAGITVAAQCRDGERLVHEHSAPHPSYDAAQTQRKYDFARRADKPMRCATIRYERGGEPYCSACPHWGAIKGPIVLGQPRIVDPELNGHARASAVPSSGEAPDEERYSLSDLGNARRLVKRHGRDLRYCHPWAKWLVWDGQRWRPDDSGEVIRRAKETVGAIYREAAGAGDEDERKALAKFALKSEAEARITAMVALAESESGIAVRPDDLDRDPSLLNVANGTLDLRTGDLRAHDRADRITKLAPVAYDDLAACPGWLAFLDVVLAAKPDLIRFVRRAVGYSLTGLTTERLLFILWGVGRNGKTTLLETVAALLGDYALRTPTETILAKRDGGIPNDVARLKGMRFVIASEAEEGRRLDEAKVKDLTGGDTLSARFMRGEWFDFRPEFKLWLGTNHKPVIRGTDHAIWDRLRLLPFEVRIPEERQDKGLRDRLVAEAPGILAWAVEGCLEWQRSGLGAPDTVRAATDAYRTEQDVFGAFLADCCRFEPGATTTAKALYAAYQRWCEDNGEKPTTQKAVGQRLAERGLEQIRLTGGARAWRGVALTGSDAATAPEMDLEVTA